jgi:hypothetical protein
MQNTDTDNKTTPLCKNYPDKIESFVQKNLWLIIIIGAVSILVLSLLYLSFSVDDSYITFRYAKNLVENGVWNWNASGELVEAYTNFLCSTCNYTAVALY